MANDETKIIESRLGTREVRLDRVIHFPRGIIGFDHLKEFTLLQIREGSPLLVLQSMDEATLGLLVADPFPFVPNYNLSVGDAEQKLLKAQSSDDIAILVTATIPPGKPEDTALNLLGPIVINHRARLGLQIPLFETNQPSRVFIHQRTVDVQG